MARVVVCGYMVRHPLAGNVLAYFQYVLGLQRLGHEVLYLEDSGWPNSSYDPETGETVSFPTTGLKVVRDLVARYCPEVPVVYVDLESGRTDGMEWSVLKERLEAADLLVNVGGVCWLPELMSCRRRAFIDMDPFFTQAGLFGAHLLENYHVHFTYGTNVGRPGCTVPEVGIDWHPLLPPVVPELWPVTPVPPGAPLTTVSTWSPMDPVTYEGEEYGMKDSEFLRLLDLPARIPDGTSLAVVLAGASSDVWTSFSAAGWGFLDPASVIDVDGYRGLISSSSGEISPAKHAYVKTRSGWFSDRSACYLASGRPVVLQDTGFQESLPAGEGLLAFSGVEDAADRIAELYADYARHAAAARRLAEEVLSFDIVLPSVLEAAIDTGGPLPAAARRRAR